jgi:uncharacterized membrane protein YdjX (TVP38/TMEM64 family)
MILETISAIIINLLFSDNLPIALAFFGITAGGTLVYFLADYLLQEFFNGN